jgi:hypothetical protein
MFKPNVIYNYLTEIGRDPGTGEDGDEIILDCPNCGKRKCHINAQHGAWLCFVCHEEGSFHQFLLRYCGLDGGQAYQLTRDMKISDDEEFELFVEMTVKQQVAPPPPELALPQQFRPVSQTMPDVFKRYLAKRHVSLELATARGIGYAVSGRYANRIILPVEADGNLYTFIARTILRTCPGCQQPIDECACVGEDGRSTKYPKVLTPTKKQGSQPSAMVYNFDAVQQGQGKRLIVVEGAFDALRLPNEAVALMKSSASRLQLSLIAGLARTRQVILCLDADLAGYNGMVKLCGELLGQAITPYVALLPAGEDPGSVARDVLDKALDDAQPFVL